MTIPNLHQKKTPTDYGDSVLGNPNSAPNPHSRPTPKLVPKLPPKTNAQVKADAEAQAQGLNRGFDNTHTLETVFFELCNLAIKTPENFSIDDLNQILSHLDAEYSELRESMDQMFGNKFKDSTDLDLDKLRNLDEYFDQSILALSRFVQQNLEAGEWDTLSAGVRSEIQRGCDSPGTKLKKKEESPLQFPDVFFKVLRQHFDKKIAEPGYQYEKERLAQNPLLTEAQRQDLKAVLDLYDAEPAELDPLDPEEHLVGRLLKEVKALEDKPVSIENNPRLRALFESCRGFGNFLGSFAQKHQSKLERCNNEESVLRHLFLNPTELYESAKMAFTSVTDGLLDAGEWNALHQLIKPRFEAAHSSGDYASGYTEFMKLDDPEIFFSCLKNYMDTQVQKADNNGKKSQLFSSLFLTDDQKELLVETVTERQVQLQSIDMDDENAFERSLTHAFSQLERLKNVDVAFKAAIKEYLIQSFVFADRSFEEFELLKKHNDVPDEAVFAAAQQAVEKRAEGQNETDQYQLYVGWASVLEPSYAQAKIGELEAASARAKLASASTPQDLEQLKRENIDVAAKAFELYNAAKDAVEPLVSKAGQLVAWRGLLEEAFIESEKTRFLDSANTFEEIGGLKKLDLFKGGELQPRALEIANREAGQQDRVEAKIEIYKKWGYLLPDSVLKAQLTSLEQSKQREDFNRATDPTNLKALLDDGFNQNEIFGKARDLASQAMGNKGTSAEKIPVLEAWEEILDPTFYAETHAALIKEKLDEDFAIAQSFDALKGLKDAGFDIDRIQTRAKEVLEGEFSGTPSEQKALLKKWNDESLLRAEDFAAMQARIKSERSVEKLAVAASVDDLKKLIGRIDDQDLHAKAKELFEPELTGDVSAQETILDDWKDVLPADYVATKRAELQDGAFAAANDPAALKALLDGGTEAGKIHGKAQQLAGQEMGGKTPAEKLVVLAKWQEIVDPNWFDTTRVALEKEKTQAEFQEAYDQARGPAVRLAVIRAFKAHLESSDFDEKVAEAQLDVVQNADDLSELLKFASTETLGEDAQNALPDAVKSCVTNALGFINKTDSDALDQAKAIASDEVAKHVGQSWVEQVLAPFKSAAFNFGSGFGSFQDIMGRFSEMQTQGVEAEAQRGAMKTAILELAEKDLKAFYKAGESLIQTCPVKELSSVLEEVSRQVERQVKFDALAESFTIYSSLASGQKDSAMGWPEAYQAGFAQVEDVLPGFYGSLKGKLWSIAVAKDGRIARTTDPDWAGNNIHSNRTYALQALRTLFREHSEQLFTQDERNAIDGGVFVKTNPQNPVPNWGELHRFDDLNIFIEAAKETAFNGKDPFEKLRSFA